MNERTKKKKLPDVAGVPEFSLMREGESASSLPAFGRERERAGLGMSWCLFVGTREGMGNEM